MRNLGNAMRNKTVRVLLLDDNDDYREAVGKTLELLGAHVSHASDSEKAKELLKQGAFEVIISDINLGNSKPAGDLFITENYDLMKGADVFAVTGYGADRVNRIDELRNLGVPVIEKGAGLLEFLRDVVSSNREKLKKAMEEQVSHALKSGAITRPAEEKVRTRRLRIFLCHSSNDKTSVRVLYRRLRDDGFEPWLDEEDLLPGQEWKREIPKAVRKSDVVVVCLSSAAINKRGYVQKEIKIALDIADEQPEGTIYIIPLRLEECEVPERLSHWQWVDFFKEEGYRRLVRSLETALATFQNLEN
jgi:CheY-like chemotaxis protein